MLCQPIKDFFTKENSQLPLFTVTLLSVQKILSQPHLCFRFGWKKLNMPITILIYKRLLNRKIYIFVFILQDLLTRAGEVTNLLSIWPLQPVCKKQADQQVFIFLSSRSRQVFLNRLFSETYFRQEGRKKGKKGNMFSSRTGYFMSCWKNLFPVFLSFSAFLSEIRP